jgi:hypothetical protein
LEEAVSFCSVADRKSCIWMQHAKSFKCMGLLQTFALRGTSLMWDGDWFNWKQWSWQWPDEITHTCLFQTSHKQRCKIPGILLQVTSSNCGVLLQFYTCSVQHFYTAGMILLQPIQGFWETEPVVVNIHQ